MLAVLSTHPIQYQVPLWQMLAREASIPFEVWYLTEHATRISRDREFSRNFAWDLKMLEGYPHRFLKTTEGASPNTPLGLRIAQPLNDLIQETKTKAIWVQGWQVAAYWQAVWQAKKMGLDVWLRGESNNLKEQGLGSKEQKAARGGLKQTAKRILLGQLFRRVDQFLCIGTANRELYRSYGVPESKLHMTPYAVDNERFRRQAEALREHRSDIRSQWGIQENAFVVLFCGKFIPKKRPLDLIKAVQLLPADNQLSNVHLLLVGSGELGAEMRAGCAVVFDADALDSQSAIGQTRCGELPAPSSKKPPASFAGFLNQTEISKAYVAADVLVLPSDYGETWGLVVNEAMASGLPCVISDRCGCALDLGTVKGNCVFACGDITGLAQKLNQAAVFPVSVDPAAIPSLQTTAATATVLYQRLNSR